MESPRTVEITSNPRHAVFCLFHWKLELSHYVVTIEPNQIRISIMMSVTLLTVNFTTNAKVFKEQWLIYT